jgi:O-antigen/teichoic acid export membrane protein
MSARTVLILASIVSLTLAAIAPFFNWPAELIGALASGILFAAADQYVAWRARRTRKSRKTPVTSTVTHSPATAVSVIVGGDNPAADAMAHTMISGGYTLAVRRAARRAWWWRLWRRITPVGTNLISW